MKAISSHTFGLAKLAHDTLQSATHYNGARLVRLYCDTEYRDARLQGPILTFNLQRSNGEFIGYNEVSAHAHSVKVILNTFIMCNVLMNNVPE